MITADKDRIYEFVSRRINHWEWGNFTALGIERHGRIIGGVLFNQYVENVRCSIHCAGDGNWLTRDFLWMVFDYAFNQLNCKVIVNTVPVSNKESMRFTEHIGFTPSLPIKDGAEDGDLMVFVLHKDDCKWLDNEKLQRKYYAKSEKLAA